MCQIIVKEAGKQIDFKLLDKAQKHNSDGYGVSWYEDNRVKTYKTFNYNVFKGIVASLKHFTIVVHLRNTTKGDNTYDNLHPYEIPSGVMFHNGTMKGLGDTKKSDSRELAEIIAECDYKYIEDILPFIKRYVNDSINRLVFFEANGQITIINKHLGIQEDGIWYSNDYHQKEGCWCREGTTTYSPFEDDEDDEFHKVFVYGTLKKGFGNHSLLKNAYFIGNATTIFKWVMVGKGKAFPYLIEEDDKKGKYISGEVYLVTNRELLTLDTLEGVPYHYIKQEIDIIYDKDSTLDVATTYTKAHYDINSYQVQDYISKW